MSDKAAYIYTLADSRVDDPIERVRYVGRTVNLGRRLKAHQQTCRDGEHTARACWMRSVYADGGDVLMEVVETTTPAGCVAAEVAWIARLRLLGAKLMNLTDGGEGLLNPSPETRRRIGAAKRGHKFWVGKHHTEASKAKMAAYRTGRPNPSIKEVTSRPEVRAKIAATLRAKTLTPEELQRKRASASACLHTQDARARMRVSVNTPEHRALLRARASTPENLERTRLMGLAQRGKQHSEAFRMAAAERWTGRKHKESTKQKMSAWQRGGNSHRAKLTEEQVRAIREKYATGSVSQRGLAREYGVEPRTINLIVHNKTWVAA